MAQTHTPHGDDCDHQASAAAETLTGVGALKRRGERTAGVLQGADRRLGFFREALHLRCKRHDRRAEGGGRRIGLDLCESRARGVDGAADVVRELIELLLGGLSLRRVGRRDSLDLGEERLRRGLGLSDARLERSLRDSAAEARGDALDLLLPIADRAADAVCVRLVGLRVRTTAATSPYQGQNSDQRQNRCSGDASSGMTTTTSTSPIKHRETSLESFEPSRLPFASQWRNREHELRPRRTPRFTRARYEVASATLGRTCVVAHHADRMIRSDSPNATLLDEAFQRPVLGWSAFEKEENDGICHQRTGRSLYRDLP